MQSTSEILATVSALRVTDSNEATTRQRVIDEIVYGVLGWQKEDVSVEERVTEDEGQGYIDYICQTAQTSLLIEAKRVNADFGQLPDNRRALIKGSWVRGTLSNAIKQARDYGRTKGVGFCVVTNGDAWIVFPVNRRDMVSFEESACIIFKNAESALSTDSEEFLELLSRESVIDGSLEKSLLGGEKNQTDLRRLNQLYDRSFSRVTRTSVFSYIEQAIVTAFSEELLSDNPEILAKAYVETPDRIRFDDRIKMYVAKRDSVLNRRPLRPVGKGDLSEISSRLVQTRVESRPVALLTLGLVGAGKTTFLNYVSKVSAKTFFQYDASRATAHWIYVDFRDFSSDKTPRSHIIKRAFTYITEHEFLRDYDRCLKHAYSKDIDSLKAGPLAVYANDEGRLRSAIADVMLKEYEEKEPFVIKVLSYSARNAPVFLVIDNVDQIESGAAQSSIFLDSLSLARELRSNLVLAMRDSTYLKNRNSPVFDAFDFDAIYIDPPSIQAVLAKRFTIAGQLVQGQSFEFTTDGGARMKVENAKPIVELLAVGVLNTEVGKLIEVAATGDTRLALQMTRQFLQYGYSSSTRAIEIHQRTGSYNLPPHEALRAIMFGNQSIYQDQFSPIGNPFDAKLGRSEAQFLRLYIMTALVYSARDRSFGGLDAHEIIHTLEKIGFSEKTTEKVLRDLMGFRYIFSRSHQDYSREATILPSRLAGYVVRELIGKFVFLETTLYDTFISSDPIWSELRATFKRIYGEHDRTTKFRLRKEAVTTFFDYIQQQVQRLVDEAQRRALPPNWCINAMQRIRNDFDQDKDRALRSALRNYTSQPNATKEVDELPLFVKTET